MHEFFVSYSRHDADIARAVAESLDAFGVPAWMAESQILIEGRKTKTDESQLRELLADAAARSRRCLLLASKAALESVYVMRDEVAPFKEREEMERQQFIWPVVVGEGGANARDGWLPEWQGRAPLQCRDQDDAERLVREVCRDAGVAIADDSTPIRRASAKTVPTLLTVNTEHRTIRLRVDIGTEWTPRPPLGRGMLLNLRNSETDLALNLIVGAMPPDFARQKGTEHVEAANFFAEKFIARRMALLSELRRPADVSPGRIGAFLKLKFMTSVTGRPEELGSHVVNVLGQPHFAYTYRLPGGIIGRKYSLILAPPRTDRLFEFVFTAGYPGAYREFVKRISRADDIVRSFRFSFSE